MKPFGIDLAVEADSVRVAVSGEIDMATAPAFQQAIMRAHEAGPGDVVVDLRDVAFMDSRGLAALVVAHRRVAAERGRLRVINARAGVSRLLDVSGVGPHLGLDEPV